MREHRIIILICVATLFAAAIISLDCSELARRVQTSDADYVVMIDPGHGGMDGGASSCDGILEKDINLAIAVKLAELVEWYDCTAVLTRETDEWLCDTEEGSIRSRKTADLMARREMIRKYEPDLTVSIHLNSFKEDPSVRGAQVFYPSSGGSDVVLQQCSMLADTMQQVMNSELQPGGPRTAMTRDGVFIFKEVLSPVIIVECGFMSNPEEADKLTTEKYQLELAQCIMTAIADFAQLEKPRTVEIIDSLR